MIEITKSNIEKPIQKARQTKPLVKIIEFRLYSVTNKTTGANYTVKFTKLGNKKLAECNCKATIICYHIAASLPIHLVLAEQLHTATA